RPPWKVAPTHCWVSKKTSSLVSSSRPAPAWTATPRLLLNQPMTQRPTCSPVQPHSPTSITRVWTPKLVATSTRYRWKTTDWVANDSNPLGHQQRPLNAEEPVREIALSLQRIKYKRGEGYGACTLRRFIIWAITKL